MRTKFGQSMMKSVNSATRSKLFVIGPTEMLT